MSISNHPMAWICDICNLELPIHLVYCLCGGERSTKRWKLYLLHLPSVLLLHICLLLPYCEVIRLQIVSTFWHQFLTSEKARDWPYFPVLINIQFSYIIRTFTIFDALDIIKKDIIATREIASDISISKWSY